MVADVTNNERVKRWRRNNRAAYNAYMREYMKEWRRRRREDDGDKGVEDSRGREAEG